MIVQASASGDATVSAGDDDLSQQCRGGQWLQLPRTNAGQTPLFLLTAVGDEKYERLKRGPKDLTAQYILLRRHLLTPQAAIASRKTLAAVTLLTERVTQNQSWTIAASRYLPKGG